MIDPDQLKSLIIIPALKYINMYSGSAVNLLLGTCAQESKMGQYLKQLGGGPALGIYQIEPDTHSDVLYNYIAYREKLRNRFSMLRTDLSYDYNLMGNLHYSTAIARVIYYRAKGPLPPSGDIEGLAAYWKKHYNTDLGKGKVSDFINNYKRYIS